jgi:hypothetical protein
MDRLSCFKGRYFVHPRVEVEHVRALGPLPFEDRADLRLELPELPGADRAGAIDGNCDHLDALVARGPEVQRLLAADGVALQHILLSFQHQKADGRVTSAPASFVCLGGARTSL